MGSFKIAIFGLKVRVANNAPALEKQLRRAGFDGLAFDEDACGLTFLPGGNSGATDAVIYIDGNSAGTIAHEASHLVDFCFEHYGIGPGAESTEIRAYLMGYCVKKITKLVSR